VARRLDCDSKVMLTITSFMLTVCMLLLCGVTTAQEQESQQFYPGKLVIKVGRDVVEMPYPVIGLTLSTDRVNSGASPDSAMYLDGDLTVYKVTRVTHSRTTDGYSQSEYAAFPGTAAESQSVSLQSERFNRALSSFGVKSLRRSDEYAIPGDTMIWNRKKGIWKPIPDLSLYYTLTFDTSVNLDEVVATLKRDASVIDAYKMAIPIADDCSLDGDSLAPDDYYLPTQFQYLRARNYSTGGGGVGAMCAWGQMPTLPDGSVRVGLIDAYPVDTAHEDLAGNWRITRSSGSTPAGHPTKGAGLIGAVTDNSTGIAGYGWDVDGIDYDYAEVSYDAFAYARQDSVDLIVLPWHVGTYDSGLSDEIEACFQAGIIVVAASGNTVTNYPPPQMFWPAAFDDWVISVGMHNGAGDRTTKSNYGCDTCGWRVDLLGPGDYIWSTDIADGYAAHSGTSSASAVVGGLLALALTVDDEVDFHRAREILKRAAVPGPNYDSLEAGGGNVDAEGMVDYLLNCCDGIRGDVHGDGSNADPADLGYLLEYLFNGGPYPLCRFEGNMDGDAYEEVGPLDLAVLVDYLYNGGDAPASCP